MEERPIFTEKMRKCVDNLKWDNYVERRNDGDYNFICIGVLIGLLLGAAVYSKHPNIEQRVTPASTNYVLPDSLR